MCWGNVAVAFAEEAISVCAGALWLLHLSRGIPKTMCCIYHVASQKPWSVSHAQEAYPKSRAFFAQFRAHRPRRTRRAHLPCPRMCSLRGCGADLGLVLPAGRSGNGNKAAPLPAPPLPTLPTASFVRTRESCGCTFCARGLVTPVVELRLHLLHSRPGHACGRAASAPCTRGLVTPVVELCLHLLHSRPGHACGRAASAPFTLAAWSRLW